MKRQTLLSAARPCSLPPRGIILFFDLSNNAPARLAVTSPSPLPDVSIIFHTFLTPTLLPPPANDSLYLMASTRHANFSNIRILTHTPCTHLLLWLALYALQIWVRRPASLEEAGNGWGGGGRVLISHDRCTSYQTAEAASRWHLETSITAEQDKPHKETAAGRVGAVLKVHTIGTHCSCCGMTETRCSRQCFNLNFLTFSVPDQPAADWLFLPLFRRTANTPTSATLEALRTPRTDPSERPHCLVWTYVSVLVAVKETAGFKVTPWMDGLKGGLHALRLRSDWSFLHILM